MVQARTYDPPQHFGDRQEPDQPEIHFTPGPLGPLVSFTGPPTFDHSKWQPIGDAVAQALAQDQQNILGFLLPAAVQYARERLDDGDDRRFFETRFTVLAMCIGQTIYEQYPDGSLTPFRLLFARAIPKYAVEVVYQGSDGAKKTEIVSVEDLHSQTGVCLCVNTEGRAPYVDVPYAAFVPKNWSIYGSEHQQRRDKSEGRLTQSSARERGLADLDASDIGPKRRRLETAGRPQVTFCGRSLSNTAVRSA